MILLKGNIVYQGKASKSVEYFGEIGFPNPPYTNPADFFMKITNELDVAFEAEQKNETLTQNQILEAFNERTELMTQKYKERLADSEMMKRPYLMAKL
jgi:hypothetical protein